MAEGRLLANSLLSAIPLPNHLHLISGTGVAGAHAISRVLWGRTKPGFQRHIQRQGDNIQHSTAESMSSPALTQLLKSPVCLRRTRKRHRAQMCPTVPSLLVAASGGCTGHSIPGTTRSHGRCHRLQNTNQKLHPSPILLLL